MSLCLQWVESCHCNDYPNWMITLEVATSRPFPHVPETRRLGIEIDPNKKSDRLPSLWQRQIINSATGVLVHIFDEDFIGSPGVRWLYDSVDTEGWRRFRFKKAQENEFLDLVSTCVSDTGLIWLLCDAQFGPDARIFQPHSLARFRALYRRAGIRINSAIPITA
jgi:hypothetical protein